MNSRIEKDLYFLAAIHLADQFWVNVYDVTLSMIVETTAEPEAHVAIERISYYIENILQNSIFVDNDDTETIEKYIDAGIAVCRTPGIPHDQVVASVLMLKLNAIMEGRIVITDIVMASKLNGGLRYNVVVEVAEESFSGNNWWNTPDLSISNSTVELIDTTNIVKLFDSNEWLDLELGWK
jgi:hypothetical protein